MWFNTPSRFTVKKPILSHFASIMHDHFRFELLQQSDYKFSFQSDFPIYREFIDTLDSRYGLEVLDAISHSSDFYLVHSSAKYSSGN